MFTATSRKDKASKATVKPLSLLKDNYRNSFHKFFKCLIMIPLIITARNMNKFTVKFDRAFVVGKV